ncbi:VCBS repeat-containing protein [Ruegeria sp. Ofav3-42]|uniref:FG-GAP repeat domain-containing protein n=1 Tax=Ruegeria sp. Ofav3-42 TaxID=2917759 RepID=UPI001EF626C1|nr:VCBS repeat-containing protein [Ruegeria sp. Ofav3-42]MCG7519687.1 VCBS repeat-containing protein [Ruegeria sp. Ofav3-42]
MPPKAPRLPVRIWQCRARGALLGLYAWLAGVAPAISDTAISARFTEPTDRYAHGVLGDDIEYGALEIKTSNAASQGLLIQPVYKYSTITIKLPLDRVFEDLEPRIVDIDQDGTSEVIVVESSVYEGAQLAIYDSRGEKIAATPHIGTRFRWLAPVGAADLDGDGNVEIAYVDRPHLAKTLRIWRFENGKLTEIASLPNLTNHRIGEDFISSGLNDCSDTPELILVNGNWTRIISVSHVNEWATTDLGPFTGPKSLKRAMTC